MVVQVEQLVYTSFPEIGFKSVASNHIPPKVQENFVQTVVDQYWDAYNPPSTVFRAVYLRQLSAQESLFGWLYNDGTDDVGRSHVPYFISYYLVQELDDRHLNLIFDCLERGPLAVVDRQQLPPTLEPIEIPDSCHYLPAQPGVVIPSATRARSRLLLDKKRLLEFCIQFDPKETSGEAAPESPLPQLLQSATQPGLVLEPPTAMPTVKLALLIGVSEYGPGFHRLPGAIKDVEALQEVLGHPERGGFTEVQTLINPDPQTMAEAIEALFLDRNPEDLVLLYFSGHVSMLDHQGKIGLGTNLSRRGTQGSVVRSTVVTTDFLNDVMNHCRSQHQTLILDWGRGEPLSTMDAARQQAQAAQPLRGEGRTLLLSSVSTASGLDHKASHLSAYTFFLVEGLKTGAADLNCDGVISLDEWHQYARRRVRQASPALDPQLYGPQAVAKILIGRSPIGDPRFKYRRQVELCSHEGEVSAANRVILNTLYKKLGLEMTEAALIESAVFKPHRDYQKKLQEYAIAFTEAIQQAYPLSPELYRQFQVFQERLGLADADIVPIEAELVRHITVLRDPNQVAVLPQVLDLAQKEKPTVFKYTLLQILSQLQGAMEPVADKIVIVSRHMFSRVKQQITNYATVRPLSKREVRSQVTSKATWLLLGAGAATALLLIAQGMRPDTNQKQNGSQHRMLAQQSAARDHNSRNLD